MLVTAVSIIIDLLCIACCGICQADRERFMPIDHGPAVFQLGSDLLPIESRHQWPAVFIHNEYGAHRCLLSIRWGRCKVSPVNVTMLRYADGLAILYLRLTPSMHGFVRTPMHGFCLLGGLTSPMLPDWKQRNTSSPFAACPGTDHVRRFMRQPPVARLPSKHATLSTTPAECLITGHTRAYITLIRNE